MINFYYNYTNPSILHGYHIRLNRIPKIAWGYFNQTKNIIALKKREYLWKLDPKTAYWFIWEHIKTQYLPLEETLLKDVRYATYYATYILKKRWPEAEAIIATCAHSSFYYAVFCMKGRFELGEPIIATDSYYNEIYKVFKKMN